MNSILHTNKYINLISLILVLLAIINVQASNSDESTDSDLYRDAGEDFGSPGRTFTMGPIEDVASSSRSQGSMPTTVAPRTPSQPVLTSSLASTSAALDFGRQFVSGIQGDEDMDYDDDEWFSRLRYQYMPFDYESLNFAFSFLKQLRSFASYKCEARHLYTLSSIGENLELADELFMDLLAKNVDDTITDYVSRCVDALISNASFSWSDGKSRSLLGEWLQIIDEFVWSTDAIALLQQSSLGSFKQSLDPNSNTNLANRLTETIKVPKMSFSKLIGKLPPETSALKTGTEGICKPVSNNNMELLVNIIDTLLPHFKNQPFVESLMTRGHPVMKVYYLTIVCKNLQQHPLAIGPATTPAPVQAETSTTTPAPANA